MKTLTQAAIAVSLAISSINICLAEDEPPIFNSFNNGGIVTINLSEEKLQSLLEKEAHIVTNYTVENADVVLSELAVRFSSLLTKRAAKGILNETNMRAITSMAPEILIEDFIESSLLRDKKNRKLKRFIKKLSETDELKRAIGQVPMLQMEIVRPDLFKSSESIWVVGMEYSVDDTELPYVIGYNKNGDSKTFTMKSIQEHPVIILGMNEKTNMISQYHDAKKVNENTESATGDVDVIIKSIKTTGSLDFGSGEFYAVAAVGSRYDTFLDTRFFTGGRGTHTVNRTILTGSENNCYSNFWGVTIYEDDKPWRRYGRSRTVSRSYMCNDSRYSVYHKQEHKLFDKSDDHAITDYRRINDYHNEKPPMKNNFATITYAYDYN